MSDLLDVGCCPLQGHALEIMPGPLIGVSLGGGGDDALHRDNPKARFDLWSPGSTSKWIPCIQFCHAVIFLDDQLVLYFQARILIDTLF